MQFNKVFFLSLVQVLACRAFAGALTLGQTPKDGEISVTNPMSAETALRPKISMTTISSDKASKLFAEFQKLENVPYRYRYDGCHFRATAMARAAEGQGIHMGKVFAEGELRAAAQPPEKPKMISWGWHVAPILPVNVNGKTVLMVFDPSMFNGPVPLEKWKQAMLLEGEPKARIDKLYFTNRFQTLPIANEPYTSSSWNNEALKVGERKLDNFSKRLQMPKLFEESDAAKKMFEDMGSFQNFDGIQ